VVLSCPFHLFKEKTLLGESKLDYLKTRPQQEAIPSINLAN